MTKMVLFLLKYERFLNESERQWNELRAQKNLPAKILSLIKNKYKLPLLQFLKFCCQKYRSFEVETQTIQKLTGSKVEDCYSLKEPRLLSITSYLLRMINVLKVCHNTQTKTKT